MKNYEPFNERDSTFVSACKLAALAAFIFTVLMIIAAIVDMARRDVESAAGTIPAIEESTQPPAWDTHYRRADKIGRRN